MMKYAMKFSFVFALFAVSFLTSCNKETDTDAELDVFVEQALLRVAETANVGANGCYELVFPVTIEFADGSTSDANSVEDMKEAFRTWKANNPDADRGDRPSLVFPITLISEEGDVLEVGAKEELRALRAACGDRPGRRGHRGNRECSCFDLVFPISIVFPDTTTVELNSRSDFKMALREWKANNPDSNVRPELVFPISVELEDGTITEVDSIEALKALKETCSN